MKTFFGCLTMAICLSVLMMGFTIKTPAAFADDGLITKSFLQEAYDACDEKRDRHLKNCKENIFDEQGDNYVMRYVSCSEKADKDYADCMEPENLLKSAKDIKFKTINKALLEKMHKEEIKSFDKLQAALKKCEKKKNHAKKEKCINTAMDKYKKRDDKIEKKYNNKFTFVD